MVQEDLKCKITECAKAMGASLIGFGGRERFANTNALQIFPACQTVIGLGFRVLRGAYRGIEEGTIYYQYTTMAVETLEETVMPIAMLKLCGLIEDFGYSALPQKRILTIMPDTDGVNPEINYREIYHGMIPVQNPI